MPLNNNPPSALPQYQSPPYAYTGRPRKERARPPARNLNECISRWTPRERISQAEWNATCRRLEVSGRVRTE